MLVDVEIYILLIAIIIFSLLAVHLKELLHAVLALIGMSISLGLVFICLNALYPGLFQLMLFGGAITILFLVALMLTGEIERRR